ncbi:MAG TPA: glycosyltransferase [Chitinophagaceae bacterium]|nr:glycosyltransferase [Chitinophagaceae bacterium]
MSGSRQVFQTGSKWRWNTFRGVGWSLLLLSLMTVPIIVVTVKKGIRPDLPELHDSDSITRLLKNPAIPAGFTSRELARYKGIENFLKARQLNQRLRNNPRAITDQRIRAAFYVDWDPQSFYSLQKNIGKMNMVIPEWFFIDPVTDTLKPQIDLPALEVMRRNHVKIIPLINNINDGNALGFDHQIVQQILHNNTKRERLINDIVKYIQQYKLDGINIDFEEVNEKSDEPMIAFQRELYQKLHPLGLIVTQDIMPANEDYNLKELSAYNDYLFLMAYDQHWTASVPGPVSAQKWIEKEVDETAQKVPPGKLILCIAGYGYDWPDHSEAETVTYQQALATAKLYGAGIVFDNDSYNDHFEYRDAKGISHQVYLTDAASNFNTIRFSDEYGVAGTALWRLGSEDRRLWQYYDRNLDNNSLANHPFDLGLMTRVDNEIEKPDYIGDGEVLSVIASPEKGIISLEEDSDEHIISEQHYKQLPTGYVIRKFGNVHKQVLLSFDDGPDPVYTPQILDILKKEKIPAVFFIVGMQAEANLPLLKRIYQEGHEIGNHTFTHPNMAEVSEERAANEIETTRLLIEAITGRSTVLFRAPFNADAEPSSEVELRPVELSRNENYYTVGESIDPNDWEKGVNADTVYNRTIRQYEANPEKGVILFHDAGGNRQATVDALPRIIHYFKNKGIAFTTVAGLLNTSKDTVMPLISNSFMPLDAGIANIGYWAGYLLTTAFWLAIVIGLFRILMLAVMATMRRNSEKKNPIPNQVSYPHVSIIVPAYNEELNAVKTLTNLLLQDYPDYDIIFVDDGSRDGTYEKVHAAFAAQGNVKILSKPNGGKASALNYGIRHSDAEYVVCIDADTILRPNAVRELMKKMLLPVPDGSVGAVAGNVKVGNLKTLLTKWQSIEYTTAQNFERRAFDLINGITVVPGAIGAFRVSAIEMAGGFTTDTLAEDCDLTIRILRNGFQVVNCTEAVAVTEAPETIQQFMKQRFRWSYGVMQSFWKHRDACFNWNYKGLGLFSLPNILIFQIILPMLSPLADLMLIWSLVFNIHDPSSLGKTAVFYMIFLAVDLLISMLAYSFEKEKKGILFWLLPQRFVYRQLMYVILFKAIVKAIKGESQGWGVLKRTGNVKDPLPAVGDSFCLYTE